MPSKPSVAKVAIAAALAVCLPLLAAGAAARASSTGDASAAATEDAIDVPRVVTVQDGAGGAWTVRIEPPKEGAADLDLTASHVDARGARVDQRARIANGARWWPTIAPLERGVRVDHDALTVDVVRIGFREYPLAHVVLRAG